MATSIKVYLRLKPGSQSLHHSRDSVHAGDRKFVFQEVLGPQAGQAEVFECVGRPAVRSVLDGYNASVFAYGASGCGKSHTLMSDADGGGLLQRSLKLMFEEIPDEAAVSVKISCLEIHLESVGDLLSPGSRNLPIREDSDGRIYVQGLTELAVTNSMEAEAFLLQATRSRATAATLTNTHSSRSHAVFIIEVCRDERHSDMARTTRRARLNIVDLAGSERHGNVLPGGNCRETGSINKSLFSLTSVVQALVGNENGSRVFVPYRSSKLTYLLKDSLGGNTRTSFVLVVDPSNAAYTRSNTTMETLSFGERLLLVKNHAVKNETVKVDATVEALTAEIVTLKSQLDSLRTSNASLVPVSSPATRETRLQALLVGLLDRVRDAERRSSEFKAQAQSWEAQANTAIRALEAFNEFKLYASSESSQQQPVYNHGPLFPNPISLETPFHRQSGSFNAPLNSSFRAPSPAFSRAASPVPVIRLPFQSGYQPFQQPFLSPRPFVHSVQSAAPASPPPGDEIRLLRQLLENHPERAKRQAAEKRAEKAEKEAEDLRAELEEFKSVEHQHVRLLSGLPAALPRTKSSAHLPQGGLNIVDIRQSPESEFSDALRKLQQRHSHEVASLKVRLELAEEEIAHLLKDSLKCSEAADEIRSVIRS